MFNFFTQMLIPVILGGLISCIRFSFQVRRGSKGEYFQQMISGAIAGMVAVNMFNPKGSFDQVVVISVFAGTHGMAWILANSFISSKGADEALKTLKGKDTGTINTIMNSTLEPENLVDLEGWVDELIKETDIEEGETDTDQ